MKFADLAYGTQEFIKAEANLAKLKKDLATTMAEWEAIQGQLV